jgi:hypothetical protein
MNYLIMFVTILAALVFMFIAGYTVAYKRFSYSLTRMKERLANQSQEQSAAPRVVSNYAESSQQQQQPSSAPTRAAPATREYQAGNLDAAAPKPAAMGRKRAQG